MASTGDPWADRISLNPVYTPVRTDGVTPPGPTKGTVGGGINDVTAPDSASTSDISNTGTTQPAPENDTLSWGGIANPYK